MAEDEKPGDEDKPTDVTEAEDAEPAAAEDAVASQPAGGGLRNRRPGKNGTSRWRRRLRGGVAVED